MGFKLQKPGKDAKDYQGFTNMFFEKPILTKFMFGIFLGSKLPCAMMTDEQKREGLAYGGGDELEILGETGGQGEQG